MAERSASTESWTQWDYMFYAEHSIPQKTITKFEWAFRDGDYDKASRIYDKARAEHG